MYLAVVVVVSCGVSSKNEEENDVIWFDMITRSRKGMQTKAKERKRRVMCCRCKEVSKNACGLCSRSVRKKKKICCFIWRSFVEMMMMLLLQRW